MDEMKLKKSTKWTYGFANTGFFISMTLYTIYPMVFMTNCLGLPVYQAATILTIVKILDIATNFFLGSFIEKTRLKWGKYRSWFLVAPIIASIATVLFYSPILTQVPAAAVVPLAVFLNWLWNAASNIVMICHSSMNTLLIYDPRKRISLFKLSTQLQAITGAIAGFFMMKIVFAVGGEYAINLKGMQVIGILYSFLYFIAFLAFFIDLKNYKFREIDNKKNVSLIKTFKLLFTNGKVASITTSAMLSFSTETFFRTLASYYFLYVLHSIKVLDLYNWTMFLAAFLGASLALPISKKLTKKRTYILGFAIMIICLITAYFTINTPFITLAVICIGVVGLNFSRAVVVPMYSDVADALRYETGEHVTSYVMTTYNLVFKVAGLIAALGSFLLGKVGFVSGVEPTAAVSQGIRMVTIIGPCTLALTGVIILALFYKLDEKKVPDMQAELKCRDAEQQSEK
ncbi:MAG: MFS transporter [Eubacteriales bacterium]